MSTLMYPFIMVPPTPRPCIPPVPMGPPTTVAEPTGGSVYSESISRAMEGYQRVIQQKGIPRGECSSVPLTCSKIRWE